jgi:very-short-patch-repair endonuclease
MSRYSVGRAVAREIIKRDRRRSNYVRAQKEAAERPESTSVSTPCGTFWMSPIEHRLYIAMLNEGLSPIPQFQIEGYIADFAFPDVRLLVEADGFAYHSGDRKKRDNKRDYVLGRHGWTVKRFYGTTIHNKAPNCAFVIRREVETRRRSAQERQRQTEARRKARREAFARPFRRIARSLRGGLK